MPKHMIVSTLLALATAACSTATDTKPKPPTWSAFYAVPLDVMVTCLGAPAGAGFVVNSQSSPAGTTRILFVPQSAPQAEASYSVYRRPDGLVQVDWQRLDNVGGLDWLDVQARERANRCAGST